MLYNGTKNNQRRKVAVYKSVYNLWVKCRVRGMFSKPDDKPYCILPIDRKYLLIPETIG